MQFRTSSLLGAIVVLLSANPALAQTTFATITGAVTDPTGAAIPNVTVTATNVQTGVKNATKSNESGIYTIPQLIQGTYTVRAGATGFKDVIAQDIILVSRDVRRVDLHLEVGSVETAVEVRAGATLIETETARIGNTKTSMVLNTLPLNTRGLWGFLSLSPGVQQQPGSSVIRFGGSRVNQENWSIDGISFSDGVDNTQTGPLANYIESFQEVKIDLSNNSAEFGSIGQVTIVSKSGTNELHGVLFDYYSTPWFRARDYFAVDRPTGVFHAPGGAVGGPVWFPKVYDGRNKTFFYFSFETSRGSQRTQNLTPSVPLASWRQGDFSGLTDVTLRNPFTGEPFPGNRIPASMINPVSQKLQERFYPLPNFGDTSTFATRNYRESITRPYDPSTYWTARGDHRIGDSGYLFGRFTWHRLYNRPYEGNLPTLGQRNQVRSNRAATVSYTHNFSPTKINEARWGFHFNNNPILVALNGLEVAQDLGLVGLAPGIPEDFTGMPKINWSNLALQSLAYSVNHRPVGYRTHTEEVQDHFSWFRNRHNLKFGFNLLRAEYDSYGAPGNLFGNLTFSNRFTGFTYADFLLGIPTSAARAFPTPRTDRNRWSADFYALDDFKVNSRLTLNLGIRYEAHFPWRDNSGLFSIFDITSGKIVVPDGAMSQVSPLFPTSYVGVAEASQVGLPSSLVRMDKNNFAPRIGLAYRPWGTRTVFRAGWGLFYDVVPFIYGLSSGDVPFVLSEPTYTNPVSNPDVILPRIFPDRAVGGPASVSIPSAMNPNYQTPYTMQYNFTIERQQWDTGFRFSYVGTAGRQAAWSYDYNSPAPDARPYVDKPRPFPNYPSIYYITNGAGHQYNALTVEATRHMYKGLYLQSSWTWARDIYDMDYNWDYDLPAYTSENPFDRSRERAPSVDIPTHRWNTNWIYELPFGRGHKFGGGVSRWANLAIGGWSISGVFSAQSGQFLTPYWTGPDPVGIAYTDSDPAQVTIRPDILRNPNLPSDQRSIYRWFDADAFTAPAQGRFGTSAKGVIKGPGVNVWHMGFHKDFIFQEQKRLRWEMTATNIFNHPNWSNPGTNISDTGSVGVIESVGGVSGDSTGDQPYVRSFRMGLRFQW